VLIRLAVRWTTAAMLTRSWMAGAGTANRLVALPHSRRLRDLSGSVVVDPGFCSQSATRPSGSRLVSSPPATMQKPMRPGHSKLSAYLGTYVRRRLASTVELSAPSRSGLVPGLRARRHHEAGLPRVIESFGAAIDRRRETAAPRLSDVRAPLAPSGRHQ